MRKDRRPKVSIIVLNWNGKHDTVECLESLSHLTYPNYEVMVVDNSSADGSVEHFKARKLEIKVIENLENLGFAEGDNVGIRAALQEGTQYILLNKDTIVDPQFLDELVNVAERDPRVGFAGPKVYYYDYNGRGRKDVINCAGAKLDMWRGRVLAIGGREVDSGQYNKVQQVDYVSGVCLLVKTRVVTEIGLLDSRFFAYWEETDWCRRGHKAGYTSVCVPPVKIWHKIAASSGGRPNVYYMTRNTFLFMRKNALKRQYVRFLIGFFVYPFWRRSVDFFLEKDLKSLRMYSKGVFDGLFH